MKIHPGKGKYIESNPQYIIAFGASYGFYYFFGVYWFMFYILVLSAATYRSYLKWLSIPIFEAEDKNVKILYGSFHLSEIEKIIKIRPKLLHFIFRNGDKGGLDMRSITESDIESISLYFKENGMDIET